jgi:spore coat protein U-like protein
MRVRSCGSHLRLGMATIGLLSCPLLAGTAEAGCRVHVQPVAFGVVDLRRTTLANGAVTVACDTPTSFAVGLAPGPGGGDRYLRGPHNQFMLYKLFRSPSYADEWGDGITSNQTVSGMADGQRPAVLTIYGALPMQGGLTPGIYHDSLLVTLTF